MNRSCDCCEGPHVLTPAPTANRPGLSKLAYRVGTHGTFLETMQTQLSSKDFPALHALRTRERSDPAMAFLDAWATVGDVLTFYQERIANEGYLRTATERRSILELARLVGYALRPGVAASTYLAYTLEKDSAPVEIPKGALANSVPAPGEQMQGFETAEPLLAHAELNAIRPRLTRPQLVSDFERAGEIYLKGTATKLKVGDTLHIPDFRPNPQFRPQPIPITLVEVDDINDRTRIELLTGNAKRDPRTDSLVKGLITRFSDLERFNVPFDRKMTRDVLERFYELNEATSGGPSEVVTRLRTVLTEVNGYVREAKEKRYNLLLPWVEQVYAALLDLFTAVQHDIGIFSEDAVDALKKPQSAPPPSAKQLPRNAQTALRPGSDTAPRLLAALQPALASTLYPYLQSIPPKPPFPPRVYAFRVVAAPFGHNAPPRLVAIDPTTRIPTMGEWIINDPLNTIHPTHGAQLAATPPQVPPPGEHHESFKLYLDNDYDIAADSYLAIVLPGQVPLVTQAAGLIHRSLTAYGLSGKTLEINLPSGQNDREWIPDPDTNPSFVPVRNARVYAASELLALAEMPITSDIAGKDIELGELYQGLEAGRWLIIAGERTDIVGVTGLFGAELVMISAVTQQAKQDERHRPRESFHTTITLATDLAYSYKRDTVKIYGNVVKATHGETRREVLGSGDAAKAFQTFTLKLSPLTFVSASTVSGVESTLEVRVNDVQWHKAEMLAALGPQDRKFLTRTDDDNKTSVDFGDGEHGLRLPTGIENVKATYRSGIGRPGNVKAGQISLLGTRPLGVKEVINPIRASGGADRESRDQARKNAPIALLALDRLVSTSDYADFSRTFAGIGKAAASRRSDGYQKSVRVVIAGAQDIPIELTSDLYLNLKASLRRFGDPYLPIELCVRERLALVVSARIKIDPDYQWETLEPKIRAAVLDRFSFEQMELGQHALLSDAVRVMQAVRGVAFVDIDVFAEVSEEELLKGFTQQKSLNLDAKPRVRAYPEQIIYLVPEVADTLILQELKP